MWPSQLGKIHSFRYDLILCGMSDMLFISRCSISVSNLIRFTCSEPPISQVHIYFETLQQQLKGVNVHNEKN